MRLAVRVQHHRSRAALARRLLPQLEEFDDVKLVPDPGGPRVDTWRAHRACLEDLPDGATHLCVIQDDAIPQPRFAERLERAIERHPEQILLGFVPGFSRDRTLMATAKARGMDSYPFVTRVYLPTVCIVYPRAVVSDLLAWADGYRRKPMAGADDGIAAMYVRRRKLFPLALAPCLVEHDDMIAPVGKKRRAGLHRRAAML